MLEIGDDLKKTRLKLQKRRTKFRDLATSELETRAVHVYIDDFYML